MFNPWSDLKTQSGRIAYFTVNVRVNQGRGFESPLGVVSRGSFVLNFWYILLYG